MRNCEKKLIEAAVDYICSVAVGNYVDEFSSANYNVPVDDARDILLKAKSNLVSAVIKYQKESI